MNPFQPVSLGRSNLRVTPLGLGCGPLAGLFTEVPESQAIATVRRALEVGVRLFDTAPLYGLGRSESRLGKAFQGVDRESYILATKVGRILELEDPEKLATRYVEFFDPPPLRAVFDFSYDGVMRSLEESLCRLNLDRVDILHIHDPDDHWEEVMRGAYPAARKLREQGVIRAVSAGMNQPEMLARFAREGDFDCFLLAGRYTLLDQSALHELFPLCIQKRIGIIIGGPYNSGILATGAQPGAKFSYQDAPPDILARVRNIEAVCQAHGVPLKGAALQFPLAHPAVISIIPGSRSVAELDENAHMVSFPIPPAFWQDLKNQKLLPPETPVMQGVV
jgi:D-threo-aldose 1-dehydrogenase